MLHLQVAMVSVYQKKKKKRKERKKEKEIGRSPINSELILVLQKEITLMQCKILTRFGTI